MFFRALAWVILLALVLPSTAWAKGQRRQVQQQRTSHSLGGSTTVDKLMQLAIEKYSTLRPDLHVAYEGVGSTNGINNVISGTYVLGGSSRELKQSEKEAGAQALVIAYDAIEVIVNNSVSLDDLDLAQIGGIFRGEIRRWEELSADLSGEITVISREAGSGTHATFQELVLGKEKKFRDDALITVSNGDVAVKVASTQNSIGYIGVGYLDQVKGRAHPLTIGGVRPDATSITSSSYPIARSLYLIYKNELDGFKKEFSDFLLSPEGRQVVVEAGFFPLPSS